MREIAKIFDASVTATSIRLVEGNHLPAVLVCHGPQKRKWFSRAPSIPERWFPADNLSHDSFAFDILFAGKAEDTFPRKVGADAWFDRRDADRYEIYEQSIRTGDNEILSLLTITDDKMLEDW